MASSKSRSCGNLVIPETNARPHRNAQQGTKVSTSDVFGAFLILTVVVLFCSCSSSPHPSEPEETVTSNPFSSVEPSIASPERGALTGTPGTPSTERRSPTAEPKNRSEIAGIPVRELGQYRKGNRVWKGLLVPQGITRNQLIRVASEIHRMNPGTAYRFVDDDSQYQRFVLWDQHYPDPAYPYPESWVNSHYLAMLNRMLTRDGTAWQLHTAEGGRHLLPHQTSTVIRTFD